MNVYIILSVILMCYGFINVFNALKSGETTMSGELDAWTFKKKKNPFWFWSMVVINSWLGVLGIYMLYDNITDPSN